MQFDVEEYWKGIQKLQFSMVGRLTLKQGGSIPTNRILKNKLEEIWGIKNFKVILMKGKIYHVLLNSVKDQGIVISMRVINTRPGFFHVSRLFPGFDSTNFKILTTQVWICLHDGPWEYSKEQNVLNITVGVGLPLKIDRLTLSYYHGTYARVLVDVDLSQPLPGRILARIWDEKSIMI